MAAHHPSQATIASINRREFVASTLVGATAVAAGMRDAHAASRVREPYEADFLDERWVEYTYFLERRPARGERFLVPFAVP